jgi:hypothetical protein
MRVSQGITAAIAALSLPLTAACSQVGEVASTTLAPAALAAEPEAALPPLFASEMELAREFVDGMMAQGLVVPVPKDPGGGYTHEQHKRNFRAIYQAGQLFRITGEQAYGDYVRDMLLEYAELYPTLGDHPARANQNVGRLFWQVLNDAMWLVHTIQGYAEVRDTLSAADRQKIDDNVFRPAAKFLSVDSQATFDRIHNHATWATAGVGMTGYLLGDQDMVDRALLGSDKSGKVGFLRQTELLFSPDGYYTEGPYYQRFAMLPFIVFGNAIEANEPERKIFEHRDGILLKAINTTIQLSYGGLFFPFNDAIKDKSLNTAELYEGVAITYGQTGDAGLLDIAEFQGRTVLRPSGLQLSRDLAAGKAQAFPFKSLLLSDGPNGDQGAIAILRDGTGPDHTALVAKNASQGFGHGHFDKLSWQLYDNGNEVIRDYGAARFLNIVAKEGGRYLPENTSWAKSSVAHNTLVVDETSHFGGDVKLADQHAPTQTYFSDAPALQVSSAHIESAYPGVVMTRTLLMPQIPGLEAPLVVDLVSGVSSSAHDYDLPLHFRGHIIEHDFALENYTNARPVLGKANGYQHIWVDGRADLAGDANKGALTWLLDGRFYTYRFAGSEPTEVVVGESGANDPNFNLRRQPLIMLSSKGVKTARFASLLEAHGSYDGAAEQTISSRSRVADLVHDTVDGKDVVRITLKTGERYALAVSHDPNAETSHAVTVGGDDLRWTGFAALIELGGAE